MPVRPEVHSLLFGFCGRQNRPLTTVKHLQEVDDGVEGGQADRAALIPSQLHQLRQHHGLGVV